MTAQDLKILYSGGSGGFIVLHYLLLLRKYQIDIVNQRSIEEIINQQWHISNPKNWKEKEIWPDNTVTDSLSEPRLYFFCGYEKNKDTIDNFPGENLVVYTDVDSQIKLAQYKNANWFYHQGFYADARRMYRVWQQHYSNIKDPTWPECSSWRKLIQLPQHIQDEIVSNKFHAQFIDYELTLKNRKFDQQPVTNESIKRSDVVDYRGCSIVKEALSFINIAKYSILLQDFINSNGQNLLDQLGLGYPSDEQIMLLNRWKSLHTPELLEQIGINR